MGTGFLPVFINDPDIYSIIMNDSFFEQFMESREILNINEYILELYTIFPYLKLNTI